METGALSPGHVQHFKYVIIRLLDVVSLEFAERAFRPALMGQYAAFNHDFCLRPELACLYAGTDASAPALP